MINFIFLFLSLFNSNEKITLDSNYNYEGYSIVDYCVFNGNLAYYSKLMNNDCEIKLYTISNPTKRYIIHVNKEFNNYNTCNKTLISNIVTYKDSVYLITSQKILKYVYNPKSDSIEFSKYIDLVGILNKDILYFANELYLDYPYIYGIKSEYHSKRLDEGFFYYFKINLNDVFDNKFHSIDYPAGFYWTVAGPRNIIDFSKSYYLVTDITKYEIRFFDTNDSLIETITRNPDFWRACTYKNEKFKDKHPMEIFNYIKDDSTTKSVIHRVNFMDENRILICYSNEKDYSDNIFDYFYDVWERNNNKWELKQSDLGSDILKAKFGGELIPNYQIIDNKLLLPETDEINKLYKLNILKYDSK